MSELITRSFTGMFIVLFTFLASLNPVITMIYLTLISQKCYIELKEAIMKRNFKWIKYDGITLFIFNFLSYFIIYGINDNINKNTVFIATIIFIFILNYMFYNAYYIGLTYLFTLLPIKMLYLLGSDLFLFIMICWLTDFSCYISGKYISKNPVIINVKYIGKGKTYQGILGGTCLGFIFSLILQLLFNGEYSLYLTTVIPLCSVIGDIIESVLKRELRIKDFDNIFPGHGGCLDRFDSVIFASIIYFLTHFEPNKNF